MNPCPNTQYRGLIEEVVCIGQPTNPRTLPTREILCNTSVWDMRYPVITEPARDLDYQFMMAEAHWILSGKRGIRDDAHLTRNLSKYSDDGWGMNGAYGPPFVQQVRYVVETLHADLDSRQAVMTLWERSPRSSKDIPCTVSLQWLLRNDQLHCVAHMRSSDVWLGIPYDVFSFTMMSAHVLLKLETAGITLGHLYLVAGSQHLYDRNEPAAQALISSPTVNNGDILPISLYGINTPDELRNILGILRNIPNDQILTNYQEMLCRTK